MHDLAGLIAGLTPEQRELFLLQMADIKSEQSRSPVGQVPGRVECPLSSAQARLWFYEKLAPGSAIYLLPNVIEIAGDLDAAALSEALNLVVERHATLRATFHDVNERPVQRIHAVRRIKTSVVDLESLAEPTRDAEARLLAIHDATRPFDLQHGPLLRLTLVRMSGQRTLALFNMHHIAGDEWSVAVLIRELAGAYGPLRNGLRPNMPDLPFEYTDHIAWERSAAAERALENHLDWWQHRLNGNLPKMQLTTDFRPGTELDFRGGVVTTHIPVKVVDGLRIISRRTGTTMFMTTLAAFQLLLARLSGTSDVIVGTPVANRDRSELERLIGLFLNVIALRADVSGNPSFLNLLSRVKETVLGAWAHKDAPFESLVARLQPDREAGRHPIFDIFFNYLNTPAESLELPGLKLTPLKLAPRQSRFLMTLYVREEGGGLRFELEYQTARFAEARMQSVLDQLRFLLEQIAANPEADVGSYSLVTPTQSLILPDPRMPLPELSYDVIGRMFEQSAAKGGGRTAITHLDRTWTWRELHSNTSAIVRDLLDRGLERGDVVAVRGRKSFGLISGMLAAMASGGVMLPVDPALPSARQVAMLGEARARFLLQVGPEEGFDPGLTTLPVDPNAVNPADTVPFPEVSPDDPAYIFFTSGTTGAPKAVLGIHKGLSRFLNWERRTLDIGPDDRCAQLIGLSFNVLLRDVFLALTSGAVLCLPDVDSDLSPERVLPWLERNRISVIHTVPAIVTSWLRDGRRMSLPALRWVLFSGEPLTDTLVRRWREAFPGSGRQVNLYGSTESTLASCYNILPDDCDLSAGVQPVGRTLPGTQALVLREGSKLCAVGEPGEIVFRSRFLTRGYLNAPEENQRRFLLNPYSSDWSDRMYRMGDRGRYRLDGTLEILGRIDNRVKIRGISIELGEVESALCAHPKVQAAAVVPWKDSNDEVYLAAYVVPQSGATLVKDALRAHCHALLDSVRVPRLFTFVDELPTTPNGKVDRNALPPPQITESNSGAESRTPVQEVVCSIWTQLLQRKGVGLHDNFFELGGHSLLATHLTARLRNVLQIEVPLGWLLENPTIAGMAAHIEAALTAGFEAPLPLERSLASGAPPLSFAQRRLWFLDQMKSGDPAYNVPSAVRVRGALDKPTLEFAFGELIRRHETLRARFAGHDGVPTQTIAQHCEFCIPLIDLSSTPADAAERAALRIANDEAIRPFDLSTGPLIRVTLIRFAPANHMLMLTLHHIASDGWSLAVLIRDVATVYAARIAGRNPELPRLPFAYGDFARWQQEWLQRPAASVQAEYWKQRLANPPELILPATPHARLSDSPPSAFYRFQIPGELTRAIQGFSRDQSATLFVTLLAGFKTLLYHYSGQTDIALGSTFSNRTPETESVVGLFVNMAVLRSSLAGNPTFQELIARVRETALGAYANRDLPFDRVVQEIQPLRGAPASPLVRAVFTLQSLLLPTLEDTGLALEPVYLDRAVAKFDLVTDVREDRGELLVAMEYNSELLTAGTVERMAEGYKTILSAMVEDPVRRIDDINLLSEQEHQLLNAPVSVEDLAGKLAAYDQFS